MNREQILGILQCCLLSIDGCNFPELIQKYSFNQKIVEAGIKLSKFLEIKSIDCEVFQ